MEDMVLDGEIIVMKDDKADFATLIKSSYCEAREMPKMKDTAKWWAMPKIIGPAEGG